MSTMTQCSITTLVTGARRRDGRIGSHLQIQGGTDESRAVQIILGPTESAVKDSMKKLTDEDLLQIDGNMLKFNGVIDMHYGEQKGAVSKWANRRYAHWGGWYEDYEYDKMPSPEACETGAKHLSLYMKA